ncbi:MAG: ComF family protein [Gammaproteobacteria bacterium]|nr:ComF family protein [Gammaproteobacteria bacterium]
MVYRWGAYLQHRLLPSRCTLCLAPDSSGLNLCRDCRADLPWLIGGCPRCALPTSAPGQPCGACQRRPSGFDPGFDRTVTLFQYAPPIDHLVQRFKFGQGLHLARLFAALLAERLRDSTPPDCIIPVPLHPNRQRQRGFNQALEIARPLARQLGCPLDYHSCQRIRATPAQSQLSAAQRRRNLRGAFTLIRPLAVKHVALVDDVMTTGSTLEALADTLRAAGVEMIEAWVCARTLPGNAR